MTTDPASVEHRVGTFFVTIDLNERVDAGPNFREVVFRVRRGVSVSVYRCRLANAEVPGDSPMQTAEYLLTQAHRRNLLFTYTDPRGPPK